MSIHGESLSLSLYYLGSGISKLLAYYNVEESSEWFALFNHKNPMVANTCADSGLKITDLFYFYWPQFVQKFVQNAGGKGLIEPSNDYYDLTAYIIWSEHNPEEDVIHNVRLRNDDFFKLLADVTSASGGTNRTFYLQSLTPSINDM